MRGSLICPPSHAARPHVTLEISPLSDLGKNIILWLVIAMVLLTVFERFSPTQSAIKTYEYSEFRKHLMDGRIESVTIYDGQRITGTFKNGEAFETRSAEYDNTALVAEMDEQNVRYSRAESEKQSVLLQLFLQFLPVLLLIAVWLYFMRQMQGGGGGRSPMQFGKSKARMLSEDQVNVNFGDVAGVEEAKQEVGEIVEFLKDPSKFQRLGGKIPRGVLMVGPPGTGKTLLARAIAGEAKVPFFTISGSDFVEMFVGVGASRVRDLFEQGKKNAPCIIFIDEIDAVGRHRGAGLGGGHDEREQTLNQLLVEMDGFESNEGVILIAATNRPDVLDPALLRPGRFDRRIVVPRPDLRGRAGILQVHTRKVPLDDHVDLDVLARGTPGFSGADLESLVNEAALIAARRNRDVVAMEDFEEAKDKVLMGAERRSMIISDKEKRTTAYHEAGHALVAKLVDEETDPVHKVSIIPRGRALGVTQQLPTEDRLGLTREYALNRIAILMGGRLAEEIVLNQKTTGAGDDINKATELARRMVTEWGMSDEVGPLNFAQSKQEVFLGRDLSQGEAYSEETARRIDGEIRRIVTEQYSRAKKLLEENREILENVAQALLEYETLDGKDIDVLCAGGTVNRPAPRKDNDSTASSGNDEQDDRQKRPALFPPIGNQEPEPDPA